MSDSTVAARGDRAWVPVLTSAALALILGAMAAAMFASHRAGHWWGDDWALYIRQAQGLLDGNPSRVIAENQFTVESSRGAAFSPPLYPWGFPIILMPAVALVDDIQRRRVADPPFVIQVAGVRAELAVVLQGDLLAEGVSGF